MVFGAVMVLNEVWSSVRGLRQNFNSLKRVVVVGEGFMKDCLKRGVVVGQGFRNNGLKQGVVVGQGL